MPNSLIVSYDLNKPEQNYDAVIARINTLGPPLKLNTCKPWQGLGPGIHELSSGPFRLIFAWRFPEAVYVLHIFKKDSSSGRKTRPEHVNAVERAWAKLKQQRNESGHKDPH